MISTFIFRGWRSNIGPVDLLYLPYSINVYPIRGVAGNILAYLPVFLV